MHSRILALLMLALHLAPLHAQTFPERRITLYVAFGAGGTTDLAFRAAADAASRTLGQRIIIENKPGAAATLAATTMMRAKPDGYTLAHVTSNLLRMPHLQKTDYDPLTDVTWIIALGDYMSGVVVRADSPWRTWRDFIAYARAHPRKVSYATTSIGGIGHMILSDIAQREGIQWEVVPYRSSPDATNALLAGEVHASSGSGGWAPFVLDGRLRLLVATGDKLPRWPEVPTLRELGYDLTSRAPFGIGGPKGMDPKIVAILHDAFRAALKSPELHKTLERHEMNTAYLSTADYTRWARERYIIEKAAVERLGLKP